MVLFYLIVSPQFNYIVYYVSHGKKRKIPRLMHKLINKVETDNLVHCMILTNEL